LEISNTLNATIKIKNFSLPHGEKTIKELLIKDSDIEFLEIY
jgi:hypothetical protein